LDLLKLILDRRTVHDYLPDPVPENLIEEAIEAAVHAPIHRLTYPWRFIRVGKAARERIADLHDEFKKKKFSSNGGELFVVGLVRAAKPEVAEEDYASLGGALQNMALYLWSKGYGTKWSTGPVSLSNKLFEILPVDTGGSFSFSPENFRLCGFFYVGRPAKTPDRPERPPVDKFYFKVP
jgi:nitroreductase